MMLHSTYDLFEASDTVAILGLRTIVLVVIKAPTWRGRLLELKLSRPQERRLKDLVKKHSEFIGFPIELRSWLKENCWWLGPLIM